MNMEVAIEDHDLYLWAQFLPDKKLSGQTEALSL